MSIILMLKSLLLKKHNYYKIDEYKFNIIIRGNHIIRLSKNLSYIPRNKVFKKIIWSDKLSEITNNKLRNSELIPTDLYPKIYTKSDILPYQEHDKFFVKPIQGSGGDNIKVYTRNKILNTIIDFDKYFIQQYIKPSLINRRKYDIRMWYFVIKDETQIKTFTSLNGKIRLSYIEYINGGEITNSILLDKAGVSNRKEEYQGHLHNLLISERKNIFDTMERFDKNFRKQLKNNNDNFVNMYGIDLIQDDNNKMWILEVNGNPNWQVKQDSDSLRDIKTNTFNETLKILANHFYLSDYQLDHWIELSDFKNINLELLSVE